MASEDNQNRTVDRRAYLAALGTAVGTAGCGGQSDTSAGDGDDTGDGGAADDDTPADTTVSGPATFRVDLTGPDDAVVDEQFTLELTVRNVGGEPGEYSDSVAVSEGAERAEENVRTGTLDPGESTTVEISFSLGLADDYQFVARGGDETASTRVAVGPVTAAVGETLTVREGLDATISGVTYETALQYTISGGYGSSDRPGLYAPGGDRVLAVVDFELENTTTNTVTFGENLGVPEGSVLTTYPSGELNATTSRDGAPLAGATRIRAGQRLQRWLPVQVPRSAVEDGIELGWQRDTDQTTPERVWQLEPSDLPAFTVAEWTLPEEADPGTTEYTVGVTNEGDADGRFHAAVERRSPDASDWTTIEVIDAAVPSGADHTFERSVEWPYTTPREFRLRPAATRRTVEFTPPSLAVGDPLPVPFGAVTVTDAVSTDSVEIAAYGDNTVLTPDRGQFVLIEVEYLNEVGTDASLPGPGGDTVQFTAAGETYDKYNPGGGGDPEKYVRPVEGRELNYTRMVYNGPFGTGESKRGWALFDVPDDVDRSEMSFTFRNTAGSLPTEGTWQLG